MTCALHRRPGRALALALLAGLALGRTAEAKKEKPAVPDLTRGGALTEKHDWNLGPTGLRGAMWAWSMVTTEARQIKVTRVDPGSPADGRILVGDVILGTGSAKFTTDARIAFANAITAAETEAAGGKLPLVLWRQGKEVSITLPLRVMGSYGPQAPYGDCPKTKNIVALGTAHLVKALKPDIPGQINALALLATGEPQYLPLVRELARRVGPKDLDLEHDRGMVAWSWGYHNLFLTEYYLATGDQEVLPAIRKFSGAIARGQSGVGTWGHGMAWPEENHGQLHGALGGYGALNQAGLVCQLSMILAAKCGVQDPELSASIARGLRFFEFYIHKGSVPYGDHNPGPDHSDNGKNGVVAILFDAADRVDGAAFFARMDTAGYGELEMGHTGNYFSYLWTGLGAARAGPAAAAAFQKEIRWYCDLARRWDGSFGYQGAAADDKYKNWDCTGAYLLNYLLPRQKLFITGRGTHPAAELTGPALVEVIADGRGFSVPEKGLGPYRAETPAALLKELTSWSPTVRLRAGKALAEKGDAAVVPTLIQMLSAPEMNTRYGACVALGALKAAAAVPALTAALQSPDVWLRIQATYALSAIGNPARTAASALLDLAVRSDPHDPREFTQRYLGYALFYPGGAMGPAGLFAKSIEGVDRGQLSAAIVRLLKNDDGRARGTVPSVYKQMTYNELKPLLPAIYESIYRQSPSGEMFASGVRLKGLELFAQYRIKEGMPLCIHVMDINKWGKHKRLPACLDILEKYGAAAKAVLPELRNLEKRIRAHREKGMAAHADQVAALIKKLESDPPDPRPLRPLDFPTPKLDLLGPDAPPPAGAAEEDQGGGGPGGE